MLAKLIFMSTIVKVRTGTIDVLSRNILLALNWQESFLIHCIDALIRVIHVMGVIFSSLALNLW